MDEFYLPFLKGLFTGAGLIIAIGPQNAFVLKEGLKKNHVFATALFCASVDALLIGLGVGGLGELLTRNYLLLFIAKWGGAAFLFWYGLRSFRAVFRTERLDAQKSEEPVSHSLRKTLLTLAALSFLNPHVYLDTVVLLGSIGAQFIGDQRLFFALGAILASFCWFFTLSFGARSLAPLLKNKTSWKVIDFLIGCVMWAVALSLVLSKSLGAT